MSAELLINVTPRETRVAIIENGVLQEILIERASKRGLVGNIYQGRVCRVLPGMQAAFVDIGLDRAAFLHASDIGNGVSSSVRRMAVAVTPAEDGDAVANVPEAAPARGQEPINTLVHGGQQVLVQVVKDPIGSKGARLTTFISIPSCYLVYMPGGGSVGVSQRIEEDAERERLRTLARTLVEEIAPGDGVIVRTAAEGVSDDMLRADLLFVHKLWLNVREHAATVRAPVMVHEDLPLVERTLRELVAVEIERIRIDSRESFRRVQDFALQFAPELAQRIEHYGGERPIFDLYNVEDEVQRALERKVELKSGGHVVIDQTEAMTTIDVNTGAYVGHRNLEETIFKTNLEATHAIARQLRLRNLGGIIIIDFIDMEGEEHKRQVLRALEKSLARDHTRTQISEVSALGLVQMTRKRTRESLEHVLCGPCPTCAGRGTVKTPQTVCYEIFREILREARLFETETLLVLASRAVIDTLVDEESQAFAELEAFIRKPIKLQVESQYGLEQYDVVLM